MNSHYINGFYSSFTQLVMFYFILSKVVFLGAKNNVEI